MFEVFFWMIVGHAVCDFPLQGDWLAKTKNPNICLVPEETVWTFSLFYHAIIHAGAIRLITGSWVLTTLEFLIHVLIDYFKCKNLFGYNTDQALHILTKVFLVILFKFGVTW